MNIPFRNQSPETGEEVDPLRRSLILAALAAPIAATPLAAVGQTSQAIEAALRQALSELPENSNFALHAARYPMVRPFLEDAMLYYRQAESEDSSGRTEAQFEQILNRLNATIRPPENPRILEYFPSAQESLLNRLNDQEYGLFIDGGTRHLYVVQRQNDALSTLWQMDVTVARNGFGNQIGSNQSPYGEMWISSAEEGRVGEVLLHNNTATYRDGDLVNNVNGHATIVTGRLSLSDFRPDNRLAQRGVAIHGTNVGFNDRGELELNESASAGCYRASSDITILLRHFVKRNNAIDQNRRNGTPVYAALSSERQSRPEVIRPNHPAVIEENAPITNTPVEVPKIRIPESAPEITTPEASPSSDPDAAAVVRLH